MVPRGRLWRWGQLWAGEGIRVGQAARADTLPDHPNSTGQEGPSPAGSGRLASPQTPQGMISQAVSKLWPGCLTGPRKECITGDRSTGMFSLCSSNHTGGEGRGGKTEDDLKSGHCSLLLLLALSCPESGSGVSRFQVPACCKLVDCQVWPQCLTTRALTPECCFTWLQPETASL